jgi:hypothetical protein
MNHTLSGMGKDFKHGAFQNPSTRKTRMATLTSWIKSRMRRKKSPEFVSSVHFEVYGVFTPLSFASIKATIFQLLNVVCKTSFHRRNNE